MLENELVSAVLHDTYGDNNIQGWYFLLIQSGIKKLYHTLQVSFGHAMSIHVSNH